VRSEGVGEEVQTPTFLHVPPVGYMCKTDEKFWVTPKYTQSSASTKLLIAVKMHQNLQIGTSYFKKNLLWASTRTPCWVGALLSLPDLTP